MAITPIEEITNSLQMREKKYQTILPRHIPAKEFVQTIILALHANPALVSADRNSFYLACMKAAVDGLILDGREAALVVYKSTVTYQPMVWGLVKICRNSDKISTITAHVVYENDDYKYIMGDEEKIVHSLPPVGKDRGNPVAVYAIAKLKDGGIEREWMTEEQVEIVRKMSPAGNDEKGNPKGIWKTWHDAQREKTVLRRLMKRLPRSRSIDNVIRSIDAEYNLDEEPAIDVKATVGVPPPTGPKETKAAKAIKQAGVPPAPPPPQEGEGEFTGQEPEDII